jgi:integrase/recombinase XerD
MSKPVISIWQDTRRPIADGTYPVRIKVTFRESVNGTITWTRKYYGEGLHCSKSAFVQLSGPNAPRSEVARELKAKLGKLYSKAATIIDKESEISVADFEAQFFGRPRNTVGAVFKMKIEELKTAKPPQVGTMLSYECALQSLLKYTLHLDYGRAKTEKKEDAWIEEQLEAGTADIRFPEVTVEWLNGYEVYCLEQGNTINTVGIYLRSLRHIFNIARGTAKGRAKKVRMIPAELYPFDDYQVKTEERFKIPLSDAELARLKAFESEEEELVEARDFWILSYYCNGMNPADILKIRFNDIQDEFLMYNRKKTRRTKKKFRPIVIPLDHEIVEIIRRRGAKTLDPNALVFPVLEEGLDEFQIKNRVETFGKKANASLKRIASKLDIKKKLTMVIARHTYANRILNSTDGDARMLQEGLGHSSMQTSEHYKGTLYMAKIKKAREGL